MDSLELIEIKTLYHNLIHAWNNRDAKSMADQFTTQGELIGFDGSQASGRNTIYSHLEPIFAEHPTPPFISVIKDVHFLGPEVAMLRAIVGMIPPGKTELETDLNAHQTLIAVKEKDGWKIKLFQNTPAQFHGRPDLVERMTEELKRVSDVG